MFSFSPFNKSFSDLDAPDLASLKTVTEGWYVEYKQEVPKSESIAKSIAAMANSYGGWIFYGVKEESKENSVAGEFIGIDKSLADASLQKIRQAVTSAINPDCHYEAKAIFGPCSEISLDGAKCIICIAVPQSIEAPHVHSRGVIYRRIADGSEPVAETDRHMIEKMFQRSTKTVESFKKWIKRDPEFSKGESEIPYLRLMISPNIWKMPRNEFGLNIDTIKNALNKTEGRVSSIPFDTFYTSATGIIARQCSTRDPTNAGLTWQFYRDLSSEVLIPLHWTKGSTTYLLAELYKYEQGQNFVQLLESSKIENTTVVNLSILYNLLMGLVEAQREIFSQVGWPQTFYIKAKLLNVWRIIPFIDCEFYVDYLKRHGIPVSLTSDVISPPGFHPDTFFFVDNKEEASSDSFRMMLQTIWCFIPIAEAFGIPVTYLLQEQKKPSDIEREKPSILTQLSDTGIRAAKL
ncbi:ATP-binding protein [Pseudomonas chlororaphis]|uniref:AlbA family DNA-binding domain-containing protein n=1 Tax=Pseudomonas chlororaphis TaxID=587753 RepID=UPI001B30F4B2|nr:ATP-binding protein [Pseudomonas chlororaphis]MBP5064994.1 ATP-binding protein [Pseudomonas chlororaphis]QTT94351.1 ATP-binding protein [Pseudomonas chlororaphis]